MNKVILMGRLTRDPEIRYTATNNIPRCSFTLAVDRRFARQGEERQTDFFNIVAWRSQAEFCSKYFTKGMRVIVVGSLQNRTWDDSEGRRHTITEIVTEEVYFADGRRNEADASIKQPGTAESFPDMGYDQNEDGFYPMDDDDELPF